MSTFAETLTFVGGVAIFVESLLILLAIRATMRRELPPEANQTSPDDLYLVLGRLLVIYALVLYGVFFRLDDLLGTPLGRALCVCAAMLLAIEALRWHLSSALRQYNTFPKTVIRVVGALSFGVAAFSADI
jgi:hypothetical protein